MTIIMLKGLIPLMMVLAPCLVRVQAQGAMHAALAGVSAGSPGSWEVFHDPAGLAGLEFPEFGMDAAMPYRLSELNRYSIGGAIPLGGGGMGFGMESRGWEAFREFSFLMGYGRPFGDHVSGGLTIAYLHVRQADGYPGLSMAGFRAGIIACLTKELLLYVNAHNPGGTYYRSRKEARLPVIYQTGFIIRVMQGKTRIILEAEKEYAYPLRIKIGMEATISEKFRAGAGVATAPFTMGIGTGVLFGRFSIELAGIIHQYLGWYPQASIQYILRNP